MVLGLESLGGGRPASGCALGAGLSRPAIGRGKRHAAMKSGCPLAAEAKCAEAGIRDRSLTLLKSLSAKKSGVIS
jgi:hypothetical protein